MTWLGSSYVFFYLCPVYSSLLAAVKFNFAFIQAGSQARESCASLDRDSHGCYTLKTKRKKKSFPQEQRDQKERQIHGTPRRARGQEKADGHVDANRSPLEEGSAALRSSDQPLGGLPTGAESVRTRGGRLARWKTGTSLQTA